MSQIIVSPATALGLPLDVTDPTELTGATQYALLVGAATGALTSLAAANDGEIPIGSTGVNPVIATITAGTNINITNGAGSITIDAADQTDFQDDLFRVYDNIDNTKEIAFQADQITTFNTRTITMCDQDLDLTNPSFPGLVTAATGLVATAGDVDILAGNLDLPTTNAALTEGVIKVGATSYFHAYGVDNLFIGPDSGNGINTGGNNTGIGVLTLSSLTAGDDNTAIGGSSLENLTTGIGNVAIGIEALEVLTTGDYNVAVGTGSSPLITTGSYNIAIGPNAGSGITIGDSSNILIGNDGFAGEDNAIRLGTQGGGAGQQNRCNIAGIYGVTPAGATETVIIDATGQLGSTAAAPGGNTFDDSLFRVYDDGDNSKRLAFQCSSISGSTTRTITMDDRDIDMDEVVTTYATDSGNATGSSGTITIAGAGTVSTSGAGATVTITGAGGGNEFVDNVFRVKDDGDNTKKIAFEASTITTGTTRTITMCDQDLSLVSPQFPGSVTAGTGLTVTTGDATISAGNLNLPTTNAALTEGVIEFNSVGFFHAYGTNNVFVGGSSGNGTLTGQNNSAVGYDSLDALTTGNFNMAIGSQALTDCTTGISNTALGYQALQNLVDGDYNSAIGTQAGNAITSGSGNMLVGRVAGQLITTGDYNIGVGHGALGALVSGDYNIGIGTGAGNALTTNDSDNICISNTGTAGDNNTIRLGTQGTGNKQQDKCFIAGIYNTTPSGGVDGTVVIDSNGQLGSIAGAAPMDRVDATGAAQAMAVNTEYTTNRGAGIVAYTLPAAAAVGDVIEVWGNSANGWSIAQNAGQTIHILGSSTTTGVGGSLASTTQYDCIRLKCTVTDTDFVGIPTGNLTVV